MLTYSKKITLLMVGLSIGSGLFIFALSGDRQISSIAMIMSFVVQSSLAFALGKVNLSVGGTVVTCEPQESVLINTSIETENNLILDSLLLANNRLVDAISLISDRADSKEDIERLKSAISHIDLVLSDH